MRKSDLLETLVVVFVVGLAVALFMLMSGCASCRINCREMDTAECEDLKKDCERINHMSARPYARTDSERMMEQFERHEDWINLESVKATQEKKQSFLYEGLKAVA